MIENARPSVELNQANRTKRGRDMTTNTVFEAMLGELIEIKFLGGGTLIGTTKTSVARWTGNGLDRKRYRHNEIDKP